MGFAVVQVEGLNDFRSALRTVDKKLPGALNKATRIAAEHIAVDARRRIPVRTGRARRSVRIQTNGAKTYLVGGKAEVPYYGWLDFGSRRPVAGRPRSVGPWAKSGRGPRTGRVIYPAIDAGIDDFMVALEKVLADTSREVGL
jgi:hypothetical protein